MWLLAALIITPIVEIALFIQVGGWLGLWPTLAMVVLTAVAGAYLLRMQGFAALAELRARLAEGRDPTETLAHGAMILFAGALLLTPGFFTDALGFALLIPAVRLAIFSLARRRLAGRVFVAGVGAGPRPGRPVEDPVIEGDWEAAEDDPDAPLRRPGDSSWTRPPGGR